ncbi:unnamed protein product [Aphis gossypii]|nr:unnamed protein product [Aphis gossypii]
MIYIKEGNNITALVHTNTSFDCNVEADQKPYIEWLYHNTSFKNVNDTNLNDGIIIKDSNSSSNESIIAELLKLIDVTHLNEGWYTCKAILKNDTVYASVYLKAINTLEVPKNKVFKLKVYHSITMVISYELIILACVIMIVHRQKKKKELMARQSDGNEKITQWTKKIVIEKLKIPDVNESLTKPVVNIKKKKSKSTNYKLPIDRDFEFPRHKLYLGRTIGEGEYGKVVRGKIDGIIRETGLCKLAVKMLKDGHTDSDMIDLVSEMEIMKMIGKHQNVISLLGCCSQDGPLYVLMEFTLYGNLRDFLRNNRPTSGRRTGRVGILGYPLDESHLLSFGYQVANGMNYLSFRKCIHGDLAAKKVLVNEDLKLKISDFGLARDIQNQDYYRKNTDGREPIKWMAPESLFFGLYTIQSNVWSYGVLLWEIMTLGGTPYPSVPNVEQLFNLLQTGYRMEKPFYCSQEVYSIMQNCWNDNPNNRPKFNDVMKIFNKIGSETSHLDLVELKIPQPPTPPPVNKIHSTQQPELNL